MMTVFVLAVLWLIVVVPMIVRRNDERRRDRSVDGFGRAMKALSRRSTSPSVANAEVYVPRQSRGATQASPARRPVPAAQEALMYPVDRSEMSAARSQMMTRRRRSLGLLIAGALVSAPLAVLKGGALWMLAAPVVLGLIGYLYFLRSQAMRDRERRETRQLRAAQRKSGGYDATADLGRYDSLPESYVRIDDDDIELHNLDTVDLTGLYSDDAGEAAAQRRAS